MQREIKEIINEPSKRYEERGNVRMELSGTQRYPFTGTVRAHTTRKARSIRGL
jgi:hypothetical protein